MATFYVLPPRECLEQSAAELVARLVPGLAPPAEVLDGLLDLLAFAHPDTFFVHREDLPADDHAGGLRDAFGAEPTDTVYDVSLAPAGGSPRVRRWSVSAPAAKVAG